MPLRTVVTRPVDLPPGRRGHLDQRMRQGDAHAFPDRVRVFARERENLG